MYLYHCFLSFFSPQFRQSFFSTTISDSARFMYIFFSSLDPPCVFFFFFLQFKFSPCIFGHGCLFGGSVLLARDFSYHIVVQMFIYIPQIYIYAHTPAILFILRRNYKIFFFRSITKKYVKYMYYTHTYTIFRR